MEKFINQSPLFLVIICLIIGFVFLMKGADYFVEGSSSIATRFHIPSLIIGSTANVIPERSLMPLVSFG